MGYKGELKGFPQEIVEKMLDIQESQGNRKDVSVFEFDITKTNCDGGFCWSDTPEGHAFWRQVIKDKEFDTFFEKYPKNEDTKSNSKEIQITIPKGYELDEENSTFTCIKFKKIKPKLPQSWEELSFVNGFFVDALSDLTSIVGGITNNSNRSTFPSQKEAEASIALAQLCQLRDAYNGEPIGDWCDWTDDKTNKHVIKYYRGMLIKDYCKHSTAVLAFKTAELRDKFFSYPAVLKLIDKAKPLL